MAWTPATGKYQFKDLSEAPESALERTEMERGVPKQRRVKSDVMVEQPLTVVFDTKQEAADFETWFYSTINAGQDWFSWTDLRTGTALTVRVKGGQLGPLKPLTRDFVRSSRQMTIEWIRSAL